jgi:hypothetical protein
MAQYSKIIRGTFTSTGVNKPLYFPMVPDTIEIWNKTKFNTTTNNTGTEGIGFAENNPGTGYITASNGTTLLGKTLTSGAFTFFSAGTYQYGSVFTISGITNANPAVVTTTTPHGYVTGDTVLIYGTTGMLQIAGVAYVVTFLTTTTFSIDVDASGFAAAATAGFVKKVLYPDLYIPQACNIVGITLSSGATITTTLTLATNHTFRIGQEVQFVIPPQWGTTGLDSAVFLQTSNGIPQQAYVVAVPAANQITVNINSSGFTPFAYPTSTIASLGLTFPQVEAIGDQNTGYQLPAPASPLGFPPNLPYLGVRNGVIGIPGAFAANTRQGVMVGTGDGTTIIHATDDVVAFRAIFPDMVALNQ